MKPVIAEDVARTEISLWAEFFEVDLDEGSIAGLLPAVMRSRIIFNEETSRFTVTLRTPVDMDNGDSLTALTIREPKTGELQKVGSLKNEVEMTIRLMSILTGEAVGLIKRIGQKDFIVLTAVLGFFS